MVQMAVGNHSTSTTMDLMPQRKFYLINGRSVTAVSIRQMLSSIGQRPLLTGLTSKKTLRIAEVRFPARILLPFTSFKRGGDVHLTT
jgi:hypothetical protein